MGISSGQELLNISLYPLRQSRVGRRVVVGAGAKARELTAIVVELVAVCILIIGIVVVCGGTALHKVRLREVLAHIGRADRLAVGGDKAAVCLAGEDHSGEAAQHHGE